MKHKRQWEHNGMQCCCHNETMLADKPCLISWLMCKSPKYGEEQEGEQARQEKQRVGVSERWKVRRGKQLVSLFNIKMKIHYQ